jgi:hypothetical protein
LWPFYTEVTAERQVIAGKGVLSLANDGAGLVPALFSGLVEGVTAEGGVRYGKIRS